MNIILTEVGPRDGLQNESKEFSFEEKCHFIDRLLQAGHRALELGAFVHPKWVPQMRDTDRVALHYAHHDAVTLSALVPNHKGFERALQSGIKMVNLTTAVSENFCQSNLNMSRDQSLEEINSIVSEARSSECQVRIYLSTAFACPYEGPIKPGRVRSFAEKLIALEPDEIIVCDTIGVAVPKQVTLLLKGIEHDCSLDKIGMHFHDTYGTGISNVYASLNEGVRRFDCSSGGLGGCPYAPGAAGNVATEDIVYFCEEMGMPTGIDLDKQVDASTYIDELLDHPLSSRYYQAVRAAGDNEPA